LLEYPSRVAVKLLAVRFRDDVSEEREELTFGWRVEEGVEREDDIADTAPSVVVAEDRHELLLLPWVE
jgi:hypothetical protein